jgi:hypothetical protein
MALLMNGSFLSTHFSSLRPGMRLRRFCILLATFIQTSLSRLGSELFRDFLQKLQRVFASLQCTAFELILNGLLLPVTTLLHFPFEDEAA